MTETIGTLIKTMTARQRRQKNEPSRRARKVSRKNRFQKTKDQIAQAKKNRHERAVAHKALVQKIEAARVLKQQAREQKNRTEAERLGVPTVEPGQNGNGTHKPEVTA